MFSPHCLRRRGRFNEVALVSGVALLDLAKDPGVVARSARKIDAGQFHDVACARERRVDAGTVALRGSS